MRDGPKKSVHVDFMVILIHDEHPRKTTLEDINHEKTLTVPESLLPQSGKYKNVELKKP